MSVISMLNSPKSDVNFDVRRNMQARNKSFLIKDLLCDVLRPNIGTLVCFKHTKYTKSNAAVAAFALLYVRCGLLKHSHPYFWGTNETDQCVKEEQALAFPLNRLGKIYGFSIASLHKRKVETTWYGGTVELPNGFCRKCKVSLNIE
ncbi:hypothetical protein RUM44_013358 [Polyplax serrata]|uniref:Uncharacterized protein n=1 Tax=Polyplax serrata TaxID=468196 RepID=A0ABR1BDY7_POLSC